LISQSPSTGFQRASTTLQIIHSQTGTSSDLQVDFTFSHSLIEVNQDKITIQTKCSSRFKATQIAHESNSTNSL
jgi:hypothetical protein